jgi:hypothetical protein
VATIALVFARGATKGLLCNINGNDGHEVSLRSGGQGSILTLSLEKMKDGCWLLRGAHVCIRIYIQIRLIQLFRFCSLNLPS